MNGGGYPIGLVNEARQLGRAGWSNARIRDLFARRGVDPVPSVGTIGYWRRTATTAGQARELERHRRWKGRQRAEQAAGRLRSKTLTPEFRVARIRALHEEANLSVRAIAAVLRLDEIDDLSEYQVERVLQTGEYPARRRARAYA